MKIKGRLGFLQYFHAPDALSHYDYVAISELTGERRIEKSMELAENRLEWRKTSESFQQSNRLGMKEEMMHYPTSSATSTLEL